MMFTLLEKEAVAIKQGDAYDEALSELSKIVETFDQIETEDFIISIAFEKAEGLYVPISPDNLNWEIPGPEENIHVEVAVQDKKDKRFVPGLDIFVELIPHREKTLGTHKHPFLWHPFVYHYGRNWVLPGDGEYSAWVKINPAQFPRHDELKGRKYQHEVAVAFEGLSLTVGTKEYGPE